ncbi:SusD/RagB family nutrient-binding outer membrane lipoprotein [Danxiaibacter flavus]|uniref:SusD/RagB family nutrient-binding outer membrane lipoprotein n=1 Tax=Danxiaibacter flavus TaxID=3049108 RepID=A0ABV3ZHT6_9BACT|nr:SusD/RagB family nutrient-binding outer membrane lipoprotein [Chitinophagaceae bacterium DXS]
MKKTYIALALFIMGLTTISCKKFLDINKDPNHPTSVSEALILSPVEVTMATSVVGGYNGTIAAYWMQQLSLNQPPPNAETYRITPVDVDNTWSYYIYPNTLENLKDLTFQAEAAGHNEYAAIGKALLAFNFAIATDIWGDIPFSEALQIEKYLKPKYDNQEAIYAGIQNLLDSGIYYANQPSSGVVPGSDDYIYGGDMDKWKKFMYMLKARFYLRLTKAPGRTASNQADSALNALANGFASNDDNAFVPYPGSPSAENPWYMNTLPGAGGVVLAASFVDSLKSRNDPRLPVIAAKANDGSYTGRKSGEDASPDPTAFSSVNTFYGGYLPLDESNSAGAGANLYLATYTEQLFIKAEATFIKSGAAAATPIYQAAIAAHMQMLGVDGSAYIASRGPLTSANGLEQIITEKYVADFLSIETYNDWRRTGFPRLTLAQNAYVNYIPRRWPYGNTTILTNPQPQQSLTTKDPVWWDKQ